MRRHVPRLLVSSFSFLLLAACPGPAANDGVWFVQATDPHLFYDSETEEWEERVRRHQEMLNRQAFEDLIATLGSLPGTGVRPSFLVVTGDFGLDRFANELQAQAAELPQPAPPAAADSETAPPQSPTDTAPPEEAAPPEGGAEEPESPLATASADPSASAASAVDYLVRTLGASPVKRIFLVPGNNDVGQEAPVGQPVQAMQSFWSEVQRGLAGTGVTLHDLTGCYFAGGAPASCSADVEGTSYRLIGFPSHSFKDGVSDDRARVQIAQLQTLASLIDEAGRQSKKVLLLTHIPELDDPYALAVRDFELSERPGRAPDLPAWATTSPWNMSAAAFASWKRAVESPVVAGVLAGHFHDSHKEIYQRPYDWATLAAERADLGKLFVAPPLSMRFQTRSPIQARGFALFRLGEEGPLERTLFWFDREERAFEPEPMRERPRVLRWPSVIHAYWTVTEDAADLARAAVIAIAFLAAFLTIVQLWEVPPASTPLAGADTQSQDSAAQPANGGGTPDALRGNFAKTVMAGLGGMAALTFLESLWSMEELNTTAYYVLLFVTFFFGLLILYAVIQSFIEALRSRLVTQYPVRPWRSWDSSAGGTRRSRRIGRFWNRFSYWRSRIWHWLLSLRIFLLILFDTFFNVLRGRNQLRTVVFENTIVDLHWGIVRAADRIREEIEAVLQEALRRAEVKEVKDEDIRVSVSVLSQDEETLFYVARERGSLARGFDRRSVAWVSVYTGEARWWKRSYPLDEVTLFENPGQRLPLLPEGTARLRDYYEKRAGSDYGGFIVLPIPWSHRGATDAVRKAGVQISFRDVSMMDRLFSGLESEGEPDYDSWQALLTEDETVPTAGDTQLRTVLKHSLEVLEELFNPFNETVFDLYIRPRIRPH